MREEEKKESEFDPLEGRTWDDHSRWEKHDTYHIEAFEWDATSM
jgi:hypothetical protein